MKTCVCLLFLLIFPLSVSAQFCEENLAVLRADYNKLNTKASANSQYRYFWDFPETWDEFISLERMLECCQSKEKKEDIVDYIAALFRLSAVDDTLFCIKMINISIGGRLDADGPNMFLHALHSRMGCAVCSPFSTKAGNKEQSWDLMLRLLSEISECDCLRFWQYYWSSLYHEEDGVHKDDRHRPELELLKKRYRRQYPEIMALSALAYRYFAGGVTFSGGNTSYYRVIREK